MGNLVVQLQAPLEGLDVLEVGAAVAEPQAAQEQLVRLAEHRFKEAQVEVLVADIVVPLKGLAVLAVELLGQMAVVAQVELLVRTLALPELVDKVAAAVDLVFVMVKPGQGVLADNLAVVLEAAVQQITELTQA
jgi:hypothetical protein